MWLRWVREMLRAARGHALLAALAAVVMAAGCMIGYRAAGRLPLEQLTALPADYAWPRWLSPLSGAHTWGATWWGLFAGNVLKVVEEWFIACLTLGVWAIYRTYEAGRAIGWVIAGNAPVAELFTHGGRSAAAAVLLPHGLLEVPAAVLAYGVSVRTGLVFVWPVKGLTRRASLVHQLRQSALVLGLVLPALLAAAFLEQYGNSWFRDRYLLGVGAQRGVVEERRLLGMFSASEAAWSPDGKSLAYIRLGQGALRLRRAGDYERPVLLLQDDAAYLRSPSWAPDSRRLCLVRFPHDLLDLGGALILVEAFTERRRTVPGGPSGHYYCASWSPDGRRIAVVALSASPRAGRRHTGIWIVDLPSGKWTEVNLAGREVAPQILSSAIAWSPDGTQLAFEAREVSEKTTGRPGSGQIWAIRVDGTGLRKLASGAGWLGAPCWSPDGRWIAYRSRAADSKPRSSDASGSRFNSIVATLCLVSSDGKRRADGLAMVGFDSNLSWSNDSRHLTYERLGAVITGRPRLP